MSLITPPTSPPDTQTKAIDITRSLALAQFWAAFAKANNPPDPEDKTQEASKREEARAKLAEHEKAKRELSAALKLVGEADLQASQAQIQLTITEICKRIDDLMGDVGASAASSTASAEITSLTGVLNAFAALTPASNDDGKSGASST